VETILVDDVADAVGQVLAAESEVGHDLGQREDPRVVFRADGGVRFRQRTVQGLWSRLTRQCFETGIRKERHELEPPSGRVDLADAIDARSDEDRRVSFPFHGRARGVHARHRLQVAGA
jgi:hypothetical protein